MRAGSAAKVIDTAHAHADVQFACAPMCTCKCKERESGWRRGRGRQEGPGVTAYTLQSACQRARTGKQGECRERFQGGGGGGGGGSVFLHVEQRQNLTRDNMMPVTIRSLGSAGGGGTRSSSARRNDLATKHEHHVSHRSALHTYVHQGIHDHAWDCAGAISRALSSVTSAPSRASMGGRNRAAQRDLGATDTSRAFPDPGG